VSCRNREKFMPRAAVKRVEPLVAYIPCAWFVVRQTFRKYRPEPVLEVVAKDFLYLSRSGCETALGAGHDGDDGIEEYRAGHSYDLMVDGEERGVGTMYRGYQRSVRFTTGELNVLCDKGVIKLRLK
jgi:hypothetical protein